MRRLLALLLLIACCEARPDGAPRSACASLMPAHSGIQAQRTASPYTVSAVKNGNKIRVKISSSVGDEFEGFVLQARSTKDRSRMTEGKFTPHQGITKTIDCFRGRDNTLTQTNISPKREITTDFIANTNTDDEIVFRATVARDFANFWTNVDSPPIRIRNAANSYPKPSGTQASHSAESVESVYNNCFMSKGCFGIPSGCVERRTCEVFLSYEHRDNNGIHFLMSGTLEDLSYMAMGLSDDRTMGDDAVVECVRQDSRIITRESWNDGKSNSRYRPKDLYSANYKDGVSRCEWTTTYLTETNGKRFNLANSTYYLLLATGPMRDDRLSYHSARISTTDPVNFTAFESIAAEGVSDSIKIHGTFMVTGWILFVSLGILLARHFKDSFEDQTICGVKIWFALHRAFMICALCFVAVAFIVIFVHKNGWNYETSNPHAILGCIATALGLFQPIMAVFRPSPDSSKRPIFNWLHFLFGNGAQLLAVIAMFFAVTLEAGLESNFYWVLGVWVVVHLVFHCLFQIHSSYSSSANKKTNDMKMGEVNGARINGAAYSSEEKNMKANVFRILLFGIYIIFLLVIILALWGLIGVA